MNPGPTRTPRDAPPGAVLLAASAMGTRFELVLPDDGSTVAHRRSAAEAALAEVVELDARLSLFRKDSLLAHLNREAACGGAGRAIRLDDDTFAMLSKCVEVWRESDGAFDVTVAPLMRRWGLHADSVLPSSPDHDSDHDAGGDGDSGAIELDTAARVVRFTAPMALDLGGVAKGFALDVAVRTLRELGTEDMFLQGGTSAIAALGRARPESPERVPWRVGIVVPDGAASNGTVLVNLDDMVLCVSAHHGRVADGRGHIIDPKAKEPARGEARPPAAEVAAVIADLSNEAFDWPCTRADAWTKPAILNGPRPECMPPSMTTLIATASTVTIDGPHGDRFTRNALISS